MKIKYTINKEAVEKVNRVNAELEAMELMREQLNKALIWGHPNGHGHTHSILPSIPTITTPTIGFTHTTDASFPGYLSSLTTTTYTSKI